MKISTERALQRPTSARDVLHRIAWAADGLDPELAAVAIGVLTELEAAEAEIERLKMEASNRSAVSAEQIALPREWFFAVLDDTRPLPEAWDDARKLADRILPSVGLHVVGGA